MRKSAGSIASFGLVSVGSDDVVVLEKQDLYWSVVIQFTKVGLQAASLLAVVYKNGVCDSTKNNVPKDTTKTF